MLLHRPTGIQVKCQSTRQQGLNRFFARQVLLSKLEARRDRQIADERDRLAKLQRQKRKRSRSSKERMLANKARNAVKKSLRGRVDAE
jgi:protein subunit release factor B